MSWLAHNKQTNNFEWPDKPVTGWPAAFWLFPRRGEKESAALQVTKVGNTKKRLKRVNFLPHYNCCKLFFLLLSACVKVVCSLDLPRGCSFPTYLIPITDLPRLFYNLPPTLMQWAGQDRTCGKILPAPAPNWAHLLTVPPWQNLPCPSPLTHSPGRICHALPAL